MQQKDVQMKEYKLIKADIKQIHEKIEEFASIDVKASIDTDYFAVLRKNDDMVMINLRL